MPNEKIDLTAALARVREALDTCKTSQYLFSLGGATDALGRLWREIDVLLSAGSLSDAEAEAEAARVLGQLRLSSGTSTEKFVAAALLAAYQSGRVQGLREGVYKPRMECKDA
jgi:transcription initiation factor TFIIIB Brf1 subunit/transcription initiation factor TFIIB